MRRPSTLLLLCAAVLSGCAASSGMRNLTPEQQAYVDAMMVEPTRFTIPADSSDAAWGRAQAFVGRYSDLKIQTATDYVIQTYSPTGQNVTYGFNITRTPLARGHEFAVDVAAGNMFMGKQARMIAGMASRFIRTGFSTMDEGAAAQ